jgi:hypothetical protein
MSIKDKIIGSCSLCNDEGFLKDSHGIECIPCSCLLKFRAYNRLSTGGFSIPILDFISGPDYNIPELDSGEEYLNYFFDNPFTVEEQGLGLYIYSKEKGRGKTTLAHKLMYELVKVFFDKNAYLSNRDYAFQNVKAFISSCDPKNNMPAEWQRTWYVLDDLGNEDRSSKWQKDAILANLQQMLHYRRDNNLPLIITSNYLPADLSVLYGGVLDSLLEIRPDGSLGGLLYRAVEVGGAEDLRLSQKTKWTI